MRRRFVDQSLTFHWRSANTALAVNISHHEAGPCTSARGTRLCIAYHNNEQHRAGLSRRDCKLYVVPLERFDSGCMDHVAVAVFTDEIGVQMTGAEIVVKVKCECHLQT